MNKIYFKIFSILFFFASIEVYSQSLSTDFSILEDYYRREQLLGNINQNFSFVSYPLFPTKAFEVADPFFPNQDNIANRFHKFDGDFNLSKDKYILKLLPISWKNQFNSHHPEGINDGAMIPSKGYQTILSAGFYFKSDHLSIKIQPEFVHAANKIYDGFPLTRENPELAGLRWAQYYYHTLNYIDQPEQFGEGVYNKIAWGQSSIRLTFNSISLGFSNENIWWGPGIHNSLIMTNSASGFAHFTLNTVSPIKTPLGSFEGQIIAGWLKNSGYIPPNHDLIDFNGNGFYDPKSEDGRYINGMVLSYQPKWVSGLFIGLIRSYQIYHHKMGEEFGDYLPVFSALSRKKVEKKHGEVKPYDFYNSVFIRYVWPESHVEIYGEYGRSDYYWDKNDLTLQLDHSAAYNVGFRKLILLNQSKNKYIQVNMELTQLAKNANTILRDGQSYGQGWYRSSVVQASYTHRGQILGAGIGPGSNLQTLNITWHSTLKSLGLQLERYVHNNDFHFVKVKDVRMHWVDPSVSLLGSWDYKNLLFNFKFKTVFSKNYQWEFDYNVDDYWDARGANDVFNFHGQIGVMYRF